jgi:hypothetical protein
MGARPNAVADVMVITAAAVATVKATSILITDESCSLGAFSKAF